MAELPLDREQTDAVLELRIYRLARLEDPGHSRGGEGAQEAASRGEAAPQERGGDHGADPGRVRRDPRPPLGGAGAPDTIPQVGGGPRVRRRGLHPGRGHHPGPHPRRLDQAPARGQGTGQAAAPRRRRGARPPARQHARAIHPLLLAGDRVHRTDRRRAGDHRARGSGAEDVRAPRRRADREPARPRLTRARRAGCRSGGRPAGTARHCAHEERLRPPVQPRGLPPAVETDRPPLRAPQGGR